MKALAFDILHRKYSMEVMRVTSVMVFMIILLLARASCAQDLTNGSSLNHSVTGKSIATTAPTDLDLFDYLKILRDVVERGFASMPASLIKRLSTAHVGSQCRVGLLRTLSAFHNLRPWALRLFDASGKLPTGLFQGSRADLGAFDECLETVVHDGRGNPVTRGQYCNVLVYVENGTAAEITIESLSSALHPKLLYFKNYFSVKEVAIVRVGICFIEECTQADLQSIVDSVKPAQVRLEVSDCVNADMEPWTKAEIGVATVLSVLIVAVVGGTLVDHFIIMKLQESNKRSALLELAAAFSVTTNTRDLLRVTNRVSEEECNLQFLHGVRFFCIVHIALGHFYTTLSDTWARPLNYFIASSEWPSMITAAGFNSVGTFFFLSGFLLSLTITRQKRNGPLIFCIGIVRRLIRVCAPLFFVVMCLYLVPRFVIGPDTKAYYRDFYGDVARHWWQLLLQIRNFYATTISDVLQHLWYLSADFQLFVVSLFTLLILKSQRMLTLGAFATLCLLSCAIGTWVVATFGVPPFMIYPGPSLEIMSKTIDKYYVRPYYHAVYYFSGCLTCLLLEDFRKRKITKGVQLVGWLVSAGCLLLCMFMKLAWYRSPDPTSEAVTLAAAFFERILWSVFLVWITLACSTGRGGLIGDFLAWKVFAPLSRLTFGVYLIHLPFLQLLLRASRERIYWSAFNIVTLLFGVLVWSFLLAYATFILCEAPTNALSKLALGALFRTRNAKSGSHQAEPSENDIKPQVNAENKAISRAKETRTIPFTRGFIGASYDLQSCAPNSRC